MTLARDRADGPPFPGRVLPRERWTRTRVALGERGRRFDWRAAFGRDALHAVDLGCGNGRWLVASALFGLYTANFASYNETYGSLGAVVVLMLWLFISALCVILGAELNAEIERQTRRDTTVGAPAPMGSRDAEVADTIGASADELDRSRSS